MGKTTIPDGFAITEDMRAWARFKVPHVNVDAEHENFCDYWRAHGKKMADWAACWRVWMRRVPEFARGNRNARPLAQVEMPYERGERPTVGAPVLLRDHPLFRGGVKK